MNNQELQQNRELVRIFLIVLILFVIVLMVSTIVSIQNKVKEGRYIGQDIEIKNTIAVSGTGEVAAKPDLALVTFSVVTEGKTVAAALEENTRKMNAVIAQAKGQGVEEKDLKTTSFTIYPRYDYTRAPSPVSGKRVLVGYEVRQSLQVKIRDLEKVGKMLQIAADAGANQVGDLQFTIDNQDELKKQARAQAIQKAKEQAKEIASQLDVRLVRIVDFQESRIVPRFYALEARALDADVGTSIPDIETGENEISVTVTLTYEIN